MGCGASRSMITENNPPGVAEFQLDRELLDLLTTKTPEAKKEKHIEILQLLKKVDDWEFDLEKFSTLTQNQPLIYVICHLLHRHDLYKQLNLNRDKIVKFLQQVQPSFRAPFHSNLLAADIAQGYHCLIKRGLKKYLNDEETFAAIISSCFTHLEHPGLNNEYQEYTESVAATLYNSVSILQHRSLSFAFEIIQRDSECDFLSDLPKARPNEQKSNVREIIILLVLATDARNHDEIMNLFQERVEKNCEFSDPGDIQILLQLVMVIASQSYLCLRRLNKHLDWMEKLFTENFTLGDIQKEIGMSVSKFCDRDGDIQANVLEMFNNVKPVIDAYFKLENRIKTARQITKANQLWWENVFGTDETEKRFCDLTQGFKWNDALLAQEIFEKSIVNEPIPTDQEKVIDQEEQDKIRRVQNETQIANEAHCTKKLIERFSEKTEWEPKIPPIYALVDLQNLENPFSDEDVRESVLHMFDRIDDWDFDVFALTELLGGESLFLTSYVIFAKYGFSNTFKIPDHKLVTFLKKIQEGYQMNPYHNAMHACDVTQITNSLMIKGEMVKKLNEIDMMGAIISSMVHDYDHPGLNNAFQAHSKSYLARVYSDRSVLENHHCASTFKIIRTEKDCDIFCGLSDDEKRDIRATIVSMVLSTDMTNHGKYVKKFSSKVKAGSDFTSKDDIRSALEIAIKIADISNPTRPLYLYLQWTRKIIHEFFLQGDKESEYKLPVSPLMDREKSVLSHGQLAFMQYVIIPMFNHFIEVFPSLNFCLDYIEQNKTHWDTHKEISDSDFEPGQFKEIRKKLCSQVTE